MEDRFLSRKQKRKNARREKQEKKDSFYRQRFQRKEDGTQRKSSFNSTSNKANSRKNSIDSIHHLPSRRRESRDEGDIAIEEADNEVKEQNIIIKANKQGLRRKGGDFEDDLDKEIAYLEKKLDLKSKDKAMLFSKKLSNENYDSDLIDFLDNINTVVNRDLISYDNPKSSKSNLKASNSSKPQEPITKPKPEPKDDSAKPKSVLRKSSLSQTDVDIQQKFQKDLTSIINKMAESNLSLLFPAFYAKIKESPLSTKQLYETIASITLKLLLNQEITNLPITSCLCSVISLLHSLLGNSFFLFYLKKLFSEVDGLTNAETPKHKVKNLIFEVIHFFILGNITSMLIYDLIKFFIEHFNETHSEYLLLLLSYTGIEIRKESPEALKEIITEVNRKYNTLRIDANAETSKMKFIVDMIDDIKHNKYLKFNLSEKFNFFKTFVANQSNSELKKGERLEIALDSISKFNLNTLCNDSVATVNAVNSDDIHNDVGLNELPGDLLDEKQSKAAEAKMKRMNVSTQLKKTIFTSIVSAYDVNDAFERLTRLNLNKEQSREIVKLIMQLCYEERSYNPFYKWLLEKLMAVNKDHKYTYHYCVWDYMKIMGSFKANELKKLHNLAKLTAQLLADEKVSLPVFLHYKFEEKEENARVFLIFAFDFYFELTSVTKAKILFAKLVKNDEHVEFAQGLLQFLVKDFANEVEAKSKGEEYQENMAAAIKVLNSIKPVNI